MILFKKVPVKRCRFPQFLIFQQIFTGALSVLMVMSLSAAPVMAAGKPNTVAQLALYKGADRQQILEEGAKKEGKLSFYTTGTQAKHLVNAFEKKYPYIKVDV